MNARLFQDALVADIENLFKNRLYKDPDGKAAPVSVFAQNLPKRESEDDEDPFPYIIVRLLDGDIENQTAAHKVNVILLVGIFDDDLANQGHRQVLEMLELMQLRFEEEPLLADHYTINDPFEWALQDEESYPYFFGAAKANFNLPAPRRNWSDLV